MITCQDILELQLDGVELISGFGISITDDKEPVPKEMIDKANALQLPLFYIRWKGASFVDIAQSVGKIILEYEMQNRRMGDYLYNLLFGYDINDRYIEKISQQFGINFTTPCRVGIIVADRKYGINLEQDEHIYEYYANYLHQDEATPHLHIDFIPYVTGWKGKGMDTRVSMKQALKSLGFQGGNKHDTELNQWINHEKEVLAEIAKQYEVEWEQKSTHEEYLDVYNFKKKERKKEVQALEQEKEYLTAENEGLTAQIAEARADIQLLKDDKEQAVKDKEEAEKRAEKAEKDLHSLEERRERLQPVMDNVSKEIKEYGTVKTLLPEAGALERATTYRDKKIKPLFTQVKNKIAAMAAQVKELAEEVEKWKHKYQKTKQAYNQIQRELDTVREEEQLFDEKQQLQDVSDRYDRVVRVLGENAVDDAVQQDIQELKVLEEKRQMEQMPTGSIHERLAWGARKSEMENQQRKKNKIKNGGMER